MTDQLGPGPRSRVRRLPKKARYDEAFIFQVLDEARLCHVAAVVAGRAVALPTLLAREGRVLYLHGSPANEVLRAVVSSGEACVTATLYDGLRLARSGFESSIAYRSVVLFGRASAVTDVAERGRVLDLFVDAVLAGRGREVRAMTDAEVRLTQVVRVQIDEASAKLSAGPTEDPPEDQSLPIWSGTIPARVVFSDPIPDTDGAMAGDGVELPASVRRLLDEGS
ncbi:MAG TPA: pyridoxamine 5'-phosphate oxidase family protein [Acidimicrobiales bacterium]|nr:pyridoxamine 5'-phosphate oxidase family protein [Acidimicrobiales bacterium]